MLCRTFKLSSLVLVVITLIAALLMLIGCESDEVKEAKEQLNAEITRIEGQLGDLQAEIESAQELVQTEDKPLDPEIIPALETTISQAKTIEFEAPATPSGIEEINAETEKLKEIDYTSAIETLQAAETAVEDSIAQMKQVTNPSEGFVIERITGIEGVGDIAAATEDTDPNNLLHKTGGYNAFIVFTSPWVDQTYISGNSIAEKGTQAGGGIEVFSTEEEAIKRNEYLSAFDGSGMLSPGSHTVVGTVIIRTSDELTASQQQQLETAIREALIRLAKAES